MNLKIRSNNFCVEFFYTRTRNYIWLSGKKKQAEYEVLIDRKLYTLNTKKKRKRVFKESITIKCNKRN